jgi:ATP-dependent Clp protease ATP-binding subunit ClpC
MGLANQEAQRLYRGEVTPGHILLGIMRLDRGSAFTVLQRLGVDLPVARSAIRRFLGEGSKTSAEQLELTRQSKKVIEFAVQEARDLEHPHVGTGHILLGLAALDDPDFAEVRSHVGIPSLATLREEVQKPTND